MLEAMNKGEQAVLIRKGGLIEPGSGFEVIARDFVFFPTFEHQAVNYLREPYRGYFELASRSRAPEGKVSFQIYGQAVHSVQTRDASVIDRLTPYHCYNHDFVTQRLKWQPAQPLAIVIVRVFRMQAPVTVAVAPQYAGCKSWVELEAPITLGELTPVLDDAIFAQKCHEIESLLKAA